MAAREICSWIQAYLLPRSELINFLLSWGEEQLMTHRPDTLDETIREGRTDGVRGAQSRCVYSMWARE